MDILWTIALWVKLFFCEQIGGQKCRTFGNLWITAIF